MFFALKYVDIRNKSSKNGRSTQLDDLRLFLAVADAGGLIGAQRATGTHARTAADMAASGLDRVILPRFAGQTLEGLQQVPPVIKALTHEEWLVCHHDARHDPPVRAALEGLARMLSDPDRVG